MTTCPWTFVIKRRQIYFVLMILCLQYFGEDASLSKILKQLKSETFQKEIGGALFKRKGRCWRWNSMLIFRVNKSQSCNLWSLLNVHMFLPLFLHHSFHWHPFTGITSSKLISGERLLCQNISYSFLCLQSCQFRWDRSTGGDCQFLSSAFASKRLKSWPCHSSRTPYCLHIEDFKIPLPVLVPCWGD